MKKTIVILSAAAAFSAVFAPSALALTYLGAQKIGDYLPGLGLRSSAMGGAGIGGSDEAATLLNNPASMNSLEQKQMTFALGYAPFTERIVTADKRTYFNERAYFSLNNAAVVLPTKDSRFAFGLAYAPAYDYNYVHKQTLYSTTQPATRTGYKEIVATGAAVRIVPAASAMLGETFSLGLSYNMISGQFGYSQKEINSTGGFDTIVGTPRESNNTASGSSVDFGAVYSGFKPLKIGMTYCGAVNLALKSDSSENTFEMPSYFAFGAVWDFAGRYNTKLAFDVLPLPFASVKISGASAGWSDITIVKMGVEHWVREDLPFRFGYYSLPYYADKKVELSAFTFGAGYKVSESLTVDFAGEYGKRNYVGDNNFFSTKETIDESFKRISVGANYKW